MTCREDGTARVIASQRVRPEVAGPMINSAKQSRAARARIWIASSLPLLAMTRMRTFTSPRRGRSPGQRKPRRGTRGSEPKAATVPVARPATRHGKTRAQTRRGNNHGPARPLLQCSRASNGRASDRQTNVQLLESVSHGAVDKPKTCITHVYTFIREQRFRVCDVQHGFSKDELIFCSTAAGANCRSVACARSAH